jgi:hypothetical protein
MRVPRRRVRSTGGETDGGARQWSSWGGSLFAFKLLDNIVAFRAAGKRSSPKLAWHCTAEMATQTCSDTRCFTLVIFLIFNMADFVAEASAAFQRALGGAAAGRGQAGASTRCPLFMLLEQQKVWSESHANRFIRA